MNKKELLTAINALASEYLGFTTELYGIRSAKKSTLETYYHNYNRMIEYHRAYRTLLNANPTPQGQILAWDLAGEEHQPTWYRAAWTNYVKANKIWRMADWEKLPC